MRRKINELISLNTISYFRYLPFIIFKIKNWPSFLLNYTGLKTKPFTYILRNGTKIKIKDSLSATTIAVIFIKKDYGNVDDNSVIIDIGANIGVYSIFAAQSKNTIVYAYEPMSNNFNLLRENIKFNKLEKNIFPFDLAIGARKGKRRLYLGASPFHSFYPINETPFNSSYEDYSKYKDQKYIEVNCISLKDVFEENKIDRCDILKMDCEGAEFEILYNLPDEYFKKIKEIRLEYHNHSVSKKNNSSYLIKFLEQKGFKVKRFKKGSDYQGDLWLKYGTRI